MVRKITRWLIITAFSASAVTLGAAPANAVADCSQGSLTNTADVSIGQGTTAATTTSGLVVTYLITALNSGPCPIPTLMVHDDLPASTATWAILATNPASWINGCSATSGSAAGSFDCFLNAGLGVPGTGTITLQVTFAGTPTDATNYATITAPVAGVNCNTATSTCESNTDNDQSWGAYLVAGAQLADGSASSFAAQFREISSPGAAVSASVSHSKSNCQGGRKRSQCPLGGQVVTITVTDPTTGLPYFSTTDPLVFVFYFSQAEYGKKPSQITIVHTINSGPNAGTYNLTNCKGNNVPPWGCVSSREQVTLNGIVYSVITVTTPQNDDWFGW